MSESPRSHLLPLSIILAAVMLWFSPWWAGGRFLAPLDLQNRMMSPWNAEGEKGYAKNHIVSDAVDQYLVYRLIAERDFRREGGVGWSSLTYGGTPQYANTMALHSDWTMQLHRWFDFKTAWHLGLLGQMWIAAFGMHAFLRGRSVTVLWATCGALLWAANSQFVTWIYHRWTLGSFCWVPWVLWAIDRTKRGDRAGRVLVPVFLALSFLGGTLQHAALVVLVVIAAWLEGDILAARFFRRCAGRVFGSRSNGSDAHRAPLQNGPSAAIPLRRFVAWGILGVGLAGFMFVPCTAAFLESNRLGLHIGTYGHAPGWYPQGPLQPVLQFISYPFHAFPTVFGRCDSLDLLKLFRSELFFVAYFGAIPVVLAFLSLGRKDAPPLARLLIATGLLLPLTPLVRLLYQRLLLLFILGGILAFTHFMSHGKRGEKALLAKWLGILAAGGAVLWTAASALIRLPAADGLIRSKITAAAAGGSSFGYYQEWMSLRIGRFVDDLAIWSPTQAVPFLLLVIGIGALAWCSSPAAARRRWGSAVLAVVAVAEVACFSARWVTWSDEPLFAETPESRALRERIGRDGRTTTLIHPTAHMALTPFIPNLTAVYHTASIHGYDSIVPDGMLLPFHDADDAEKLGRLGVTHLITWKGNPDVPGAWSLSWSGEAMDLYRNPLAVERYAGFPDDDALDDFHRGGTDHGIGLAEDFGLENRRRITVPPDVSVVRVAENAGSGWRYRIDGGGWTPVRRGPDACMEIPLGGGSGERVLEMEYAPPLRSAGWIVSGLSLAALLTTCVPMRRVRPTPSPTK